MLTLSDTQQGVTPTRFRRDYKLVIGLGAQQVTIKPPFNIKFSATETIGSAEPNKLTVTVTGLQESTRLKLVKNEKENKHFPIEFFIGYEGNIRRAFKGSVKTGMPSKIGAMHDITLECLDGYPDFNDSFTSATVASSDLAINQLIKDMPNTEKGTITTLDKMLRPQILVGSSSQILEEISGGRQLYIKDEKVFIANENEVLSEIAPIISVETGLKTVPENDGTEITFTTMLNPSVKIGYLCDLKSKLNPASNGLLKIHQIVTTGEYKGIWEQTLTCKKQNKYVVTR